MIVALQADVDGLAKQLQEALRTKQAVRTQQAVPKRMRHKATVAAEPRPATQGPQQQVYHSTVLDRGYASFVEHDSVEVGSSGGLQHWLRSHAGQGLCAAMRPQIRPGVFTGTCPALCR